MPTYVAGFVIPLLKKNIPACRLLSKDAIVEF